MCQWCHLQQHTSLDSAICSSLDVAQNLARVLGSMSPDTVQLGVQIEKGALERIVASLDQNQPARAVPLNEEESVLVKGLQLLTMKPMIYAANVAETDLADQGAGNHHVKALREKAAQENCEVIIVSAQV